MSKIIELWNKEELPIKDGVYFSNGKSISLSMKFYPNLLIEKGDPFNLISFLKEESDNVTCIDIMKIIMMSDGYQCFLGEGSYGSEGFIAYITPERYLEWVMYFENSNPFINAIELSNKCIEVESSANYKIVIQLNNPTHVTLSV